MSKQETEVGKVLSSFFDDLQTQVDLSKITKNILNKGIIVDFWIPSHRCVIEVHGIQHYKPSGFGRSKIETLKAFSNQVERDDRLRRVCNANDIEYIEIAHDEGYANATIIRKVMHLINGTKDN